MEWNGQITYNNIVAMLHEDVAFRYDDRDRMPEKHNLAPADDSGPPSNDGFCGCLKEKACNRLIQPRSRRHNVSTDASPCKHDIEVFWTYKWWDWRETPRAPCGAMRHIGTPQGVGLILVMGCDCWLEWFMILFLLIAHLHDFENIIFIAKLIYSARSVFLLYRRWSRLQINTPL